jgi:hypothetical protein
MYCSKELKAFLCIATTDAVLGAHSTVHGWGALLQPGSSRVRNPKRALNLFNLSYPSSRTMALGFTQPLTGWVPEDIAVTANAGGKWLRGPGFDYRPYQIFWEALDLERGPFNFVRITEELLEWKSSGYRLENGHLWQWGPVTLTMQHPSTPKIWH